MPTTKQIQANRQNAQRSTGPKTDKGKAIVSQNSLKHGIFSKQILVIGESKKEFEALKTEFYEQFQPQGFLEQLFCERALTAAWRLSRVTQMESMLINCATKGSYSGTDLIEVLEGCHGDGLNLLTRYEISLEKILLKSIQASRVSKWGSQIGFVSQNLSEEDIKDKLI